MVHGSVMGAWCGDVMGGWVINVVLYYLFINMKSYLLEVYIRF